MLLQLPAEVHWLIGRYLKPADLINYLTVLARRSTAVEESELDLAAYSRIIAAQFIPLQDSYDRLIYYPALRSRILFCAKISLECDHIQDNRAIPNFFDDRWDDRNDFRADWVRVSVVNNVLHGPIEFYRGGGLDSGNSVKVGQGYYYNGDKAGPWILTLAGQINQDDYHYDLLYRETGQYDQDHKTGSWLLQQRLSSSAVNNNNLIPTIQQLQAEVTYQQGLKQGNCEIWATKIAGSAVTVSPTTNSTGQAVLRGRFLDDHPVGQWLWYQRAGPGQPEHYHFSYIYSEPHGHYLGQINRSGQIYYFDHDDQTDSDSDQSDSDQSQSSQHSSDSADFDPVDLALIDFINQLNSDFVVTNPDQSEATMEAATLAGINQLDITESLFKS